METRLELIKSFIEDLKESEHIDGLCPPCEYGEGECHQKKYNWAIRTLNEIISDNNPCHYCKKGKEHREFDGYPICDDCVNKLYYDEDGNPIYKDDEIPPFTKEMNNEL